MKALITKDEVKEIVNQCIQAKMTPEHIEMYFNSNSELPPAEWLALSDREMSTEDYIKMMREDKPAQDHTVAKI